MYMFQGGEKNIFFYIPTLYRDWLRKGLVICVSYRMEGGFERHSLEFTKCRSTCLFIKNIYYEMHLFENLSELNILHLFQIKI